MLLVHAANRRQIRVYAVIVTETRNRNDDAGTQSWVALRDDVVC